MPNVDIVIHEKTIETIRAKQAMAIFDVPINAPRKLEWRASIARAMISEEKTIVIDEFTSFVDRQIAKIVANSVQKYVRRGQKQFVAVTCHADVIDWLNPDWVFTPTDCAFQWRSLQPRPKLDCEIRVVEHKMWRVFAPYHYLTSELSPAARCFCLFVNNRPAAFSGVLHRPISRAKQSVQNIYGMSRLVTLPDFQGIGLAFVLADFLGSIYTGVGHKFRAYPAHPPFVRQFDKSPKWSVVKSPTYKCKARGKSTLPHGNNDAQGGRCNATFDYIGPKASRADAVAMLTDKLPQLA